MVSKLSVQFCSNLQHHMSAERFATINHIYRAQIYRGYGWTSWLGGMLTICAAPSLGARMIGIVPARAILAIWHIQRVPAERTQRHND